MDFLATDTIEEEAPASNMDELSDGNDSYTRSPAAIEIQQYGGDTQHDGGKFDNGAKILSAENDDSDIKPDDTTITPQNSGNDGIADVNNNNDSNSKSSDSNNGGQALGTASNLPLSIKTKINHEISKALFGDSVYLSVGTPVWITQGRILRKDTAWRAYLDH
ncbi:MAG: hypothetical protein GWO20_02875 [Candidatus Korarchaeota archaeon]|nr:hypothetical protein [Candidatus Korarchaeota archaeon]